MTTTDINTRTRTRAFIDAIRAESSKLRSLRAIWLLLAGTFALTIVLAVSFSQGARTAPDSVNILDYGVVAIGWTQVGFFLVGVIAATSEYIGGQVRTTLIAIPDRIGQRLAATIALIPVVFIAGTVTVIGSITTVLLATGTSLADIDLAVAIRLILSTAAYLALMAVLSSALGFLIRKAIPAAAILLVYLLILSPLLQGYNLYFLPDMASYTLLYATVAETAPPAAVAWLVVFAWPLAFLIPSLVVANKRDT